MSFYNMYLKSLLEAADDEKKKSSKSRNADNPDDEENADTENTENETEEATDDNPDSEGTDEEDEPNDDSEQQSEDEGEEENNEEQEDADEEDQGEGEDNEEGGEDDFSLDPAGDEEGDDNEPNPDGLTDPEDDGSSDTSEGDKTAETNIHVNVLSLSKLDRLLAKKRCLNDFYDLRTSIDTFKVVIEKNETVLDPDVRDIAVRDLNKLHTMLEDYLMHKFSFTNYEENLQNYFIFMRSMNDIVKNVNEKGLNKKG